MIKKLLLIIILLLGACSVQPRTKTMAIDLTNAASQYVEWTSFSNVQNLANKTIMIWLDLDTFVTSRGIFSLGNSGVIDGNEFWEVGESGTANKLFFGVGWTTTGGLWRTTTDLTTNITHIAITYNNGATTNDPIIYLNGVSDVLTEVTTPVGTYRNGTTGKIRIGGAWTATSSIDGKVLSVLVYNRILTAQEIADAYNSREAIPDLRGLVFAPQLIAGGSVGSGGTLSAANTIPDQISGALGTPNGSPLFVQDVNLTYP